MDIQRQMFINQDLQQLAVKYRKMASIIISRRLEHYVSMCEDETSKNELEACIEEMKKGSRTQYYHWWISND